MRLGTLLLIGIVVIMPGIPSDSDAEVYLCKRADGSEVYSDHSLGRECRPMKNLPELIPAPHVPLPKALPEQPKTVEPDKTRQTGGGGRAMDPPSDEAIMIRDIKAIPNYNSTLGTAVYQASMRLQNGDPDWTAEQICIDVRFRDVAKIFVDVHKTGCLEGLKPLDDQPLTVVYTGTMPARVSPIQAEAQIFSVKWAK